MKKNFTFSSCLKNGKKGEADVINTLKNMFKDEWNIEYVGDDKKFQDMDIDILMHKKNSDEVINIEIKTDYTKYKNIFAEFLSCREKNTPGCWVKTKSDYILYYFKASGIIYVIPTNQGKKLMNEEKWKEGTAFDIVHTGEKVVRKTSVGKLIPIKKLLEYIDLSGSIFDKCMMVVDENENINT